MRLEIGNDRQPRTKSSDPVAAKTGVFALLSDGELSTTERARDQCLDERSEKRAERPRRIWLPQDVLRRVTNLYKRFTKPRG